MTAVVLRLVEQHHYEHRVHGEVKREAMPTYEVLVDGVKVGSVERRMFTREHKSKGNRYVNTRWTSPGWCGRALRGTGRYLEESSRRAALEQVLATHLGSTDYYSPGRREREQQAKALAASAKVEKTPAPR